MSMLYIDQVTLPTREDVDAFETFMRYDYLPAVHKGPTRIGQVTYLAVIRAENEEDGFFLHIGWDGMDMSDKIPRIDDENVQRRFESFGAAVTRVGHYTNVATWQLGDSA
jgi:hypothetical protein